MEGETARDGAGGPRLSLPDVQLDASFMERISQHVRQIDAEMRLEVSQLNDQRRVSKEEIERLYTELNEERQKHRSEEFQDLVRERKRLEQKDQDIIDQQRRMDKEALLLKSQWDTLAEKRAEFEHERRRHDAAVAKSMHRPAGTGQINLQDARASDGWLELYDTKTESHYYFSHGSGMCCWEDAQWVKAATDDGAEYFYNRVSGETTWELDADTAWEELFNRHSRSTYMFNPVTKKIKSVAPQQPVSPLGRSVSPAEMGMPAAVLTLQVNGSQDENPDPPLVNRVSRGGSRDRTDFDAQARGQSGVAVVRPSDPFNLDCDKDRHRDRGGRSISSQPKPAQTRPGSGMPKVAASEGASGVSKKGPSASGLEASARPKRGRGGSTRSDHPAGAKPTAQHTAEDGANNSGSWGSTVSRLLWNRTSQPSAESDPSQSSRSKQQVLPPPPPTSGVQRPTGKPPPSVSGRSNSAFPASPTLSASSDSPTDALGGTVLNTTLSRVPDVLGQMGMVNDDSHQIPLGDPMAALFPARSRSVPAMPNREDRSASQKKKDDKDGWFPPGGEPSSPAAD